MRNSRATSIAGPLAAGIRGCSQSKSSSAPRQTSTNYAFQRNRRYAFGFEQFGPEAKINQEAFAIAGGILMIGQKRKAGRVRIEHGYSVNLMGVDGTWRRSCTLLDVSDTGARLEVEGSVNVLQAREFFLLLSSTGLAFRRCELIWIDGSDVGVRFVPKESKKRAKTSNRDASPPRLVSE
jgi:hypothetical protein